MLILEDIRYRCGLCGEPMMRDGGNRLEPGQQFSTWLCLNGRPQHLGGCENFGIRLKMPHKYIQAEQA